LRCWTANRPTALAPLFDPFVFVQRAFCARARARALRRRCRGFSMISPVDKTARLARPRSIPTSLGVGGRLNVSGSTG
jgi:hypothetical protein